MFKNWLITGSSRGLGRHLVEAALSEGDNVYATARNPDQLNDLVKKFGKRIRTGPLDVTDQAAAQRTVSNVVEAFGSLDVVVNNAGYGNVASIEDVTDEDFRAQVEVNFFGVYNVTKAAIPILRDQRRGHIIQISSVGGRTGNAGLSAYQSAKFAVEGFSEVLAQEVAPFGVHVTLIEPGAMRTDWAGSSMTIPEISEPYRSTIGAMAEMMRKYDGQQTGDPAKIARVIVNVVQRDDPPLRLLMGADAFAIATKADQTRAAADLQWRHVTESIAFDAN